MEALSKDVIVVDMFRTLGIVATDRSTAAVAVDVLANLALNMVVLVPEAAAGFERSISGFERPR